MIDSLYYSSRGGVKTLLWITKYITKSFVIHYERLERTHFIYRPDAWKVYSAEKKQKV